MVRLSRGSVFLYVMIGDITEFIGDAVVNPANTYMFMSGGVAGAIRRKSGVEIELEARRHAPVPIGKAVTTSAGKFKCRYVIHAPTVEAPGGRSSAEKVYEATKAALKEARRVGVTTVAFSLMGAGVGGLTLEESLRSMVKAFEELGRGMNLHLYVLSGDMQLKAVEVLTKMGWTEG
ncbi:MAG: macro domain-containing protein [Zestosphaera sp.]